MKSELKKYFNEGFDSILISSISNITYLTGFKGFDEVERECFLLFTKSKNYLITDGRYAEAVSKQTKDFEIIDVGAVNFITEDHSNVLKNLRTKVLGIEDYNLTVFELNKIKKHVKKIKKIDLSRLRIIKNDSEIENLKKASEIGDEAFKFIVKQLKIGKTEIQIATELEFFIRSQGADISFKSIVAFGPNSSLPHHNSGQTKLRKNHIVLLDFGVKVNNYCSDMTRTVFFGKADSKFQNIHKTVLDAQRLAIKQIKNTVKASRIDKTARDYILKNNFPNIIHAVGHGIGIDVHEAPILSPKSKDILENGMVFSVEPGIYIQGYGGVRIEDLVLVRGGKAELISRSKRGIIEVND